VTERQDSAAVGFVGLGNMGGALAANLVAAGFPVAAYDAAGEQRAPLGALWCAGGVAEVAERSSTVVLSLPDGAASTAVLGELLGVLGAAGKKRAVRRVGQVVDTSTIGVAAARRNGEELAAQRIGYLDAPVSGGISGARKRTLMVMYAGPDAACARAEPVLAGLSDRRRRVGDRPGQAQAIKLANNFLSATALAATSEALAFGRAAGVDPALMIEVLNASSGRSGATDDKFPNEVLTGRYSSGFANTLMAKDLGLYLAELAGLGEGPREVGTLTAELWRRFAASAPGADFTRIAEFLSEGH
jgi:3-hydroxyisobutyrate dehydrogenase-like beta-hydroxyacid dehydrogenase